MGIGEWDVQGLRDRSGRSDLASVRFIPQRSNNDLHASYTLLPDGPEATAGYVPSGIYGEGLAASISARRAELDRSRKRSMMAEGDGVRGKPPDKRGFAVEIHVLTGT